MGNEADKVKSVKTLEFVQFEGGDRPIRKRGYYRALKQGKMWARIEYAMKEMANRLARDLFR